MAKETPSLQATYFSEPVNGGYYTLGITFADFDTGQIKGRWGKDRFLGHSLGPSGYHRHSDSLAELNLDLVFEKLSLFSSDLSYNKLSGTVTRVSTGASEKIVFNKSKDEIVSD